MPPLTIVPMLTVGQCRRWGGLAARTVRRRRINAVGSRVVIVLRPVGVTGRQQVK
jgi:hypothetical protein